MTTTVFFGPCVDLLDLYGGMGCAMCWDGVCEVILLSASTLFLSLSSSAFCYAGCGIAQECNGIVYVGPEWALFC